MVRSALSLAAAAALCVVLAACGSTTAASVGPSTSPTPSIAPSAQPTSLPTSKPTPTPEPSEPPVDSVPIPSDAYARVVTNDLRVRSRPGVSDDSKKLEPLLQQGTPVLVVDGPIQASGYDWYEVQPMARSDLEPVGPFGWVAAAGKDGEQWIEPQAVECPPTPTDLEGLLNLSELSESYYGITCFSGEEITFTARLVTPDSWCGLGAETNWDPVWMGTCDAPPNYLVQLDNDDGGSAFWPAWSPDVDLGIAPPMESPPNAWPVVSVTGMFDHPAAQSCRSRPDSKADPEVILNCRRLFVVTSMGQAGG